MLGTISSPGAAVTCRRSTGLMAVTTTLIGLIGCHSSGAPKTYRVDASVSGLSGMGLVLQLNAGNDLSVATNGASPFAGALTSGTAYQVTIKSQPASPQQTCTIASGSGTIGSSDVTVPVSCTTVTHSIGVTVSGLSGTGLALQLNGGNDLSITANGAATFPAVLNSGGSYAVSVSSQPTHPKQTCSVTSGSGTVGAADISIAVNCVTAVATLYSFTDPHPNGSLVQGTDGNLYGTTSNTAFRITPAGNETTLFTLPGYAGPFEGGLILASDGNFYGIARGFEDVSGAMFQITPAGAGTAFAFFAGPDNGDSPTNNGVLQSSEGPFYVIGKADTAPYGILQVNSAGTIKYEVEPPCAVAAPLFQAHDGTIYGLTAGCGAYGQGTLFKFTPGTLASIVYSFGATATDAIKPETGLIEGEDGNLYGTTATGGAPTATCPAGCGTIFKVTPAGLETVLYSFGANAADGQTPSGPLVLGKDGNLYGVTSAGGGFNSNCKLQSGCGTVYRLTSSGIETVLYSFGTDATDGVSPSGALVQVSDGTLYGTTSSGGTNGKGTFFKLDTAGS